MESYIETRITRHFARIKVGWLLQVGHLKTESCFGQVGCASLALLEEHHDQGTRWNDLDVGEGDSINGRQADRKKWPNEGNGLT
jgi:hypothetical protein